MAIRFKVSAFLLCSVCALTLVSPALAQSTDLPKDDPTDAEAAAALLAAQVDALQAQIDVLKEKATKAEKAVAFKGAGELAGTTSDGAAWKFKVRGRIQYDSGFVSNPNTAAVNAGTNAAIGRDFRFNSRIRRFRLGVEGEFGGGFGYAAEADFANAAVGFGDVVLKWTSTASPLSVAIGNQETLNSLEQLTSSRFNSFNERSQFNEAFYSGRRLGISATYAVPDDYLISAGLFNDSIQATLGNDDWLFGARGVIDRKYGDTLVHVGVNTQFRRFQTDQQLGLYRARPVTQSVNSRFVGTTSFLNAAGTAAAPTSIIGTNGTAGIAAKGDFTIGGELIAINGPLHFASEFQYIQVDALKRTDATNGTTGARLQANPAFYGGYAEVGYYLTGETRGYKNFKWDRTKVLNPVSKGGNGAFQINARFDYLNLTDNLSAGADSIVVNGGKQSAYQLGLIWLPIDYVRFYVNYARVQVTGGPLAAVFVPISPKPISQRTYGADVIQTRVGFDF
jgi:phosphate-selective porin OprO and OprP